MCVQSFFFGWTQCFIVEVTLNCLSITISTKLSVCFPFSKHYNWAFAVLIYVKQIPKNYSSYLCFSKFQVQCSPLKRPSDKRPSRLIGHFSITKLAFSIKFARINGQPALTAKIWLHCTCMYYCTHELSCTTKPIYKTNKQTHELIIYQSHQQSAVRNPLVCL